MKSQNNQNQILKFTVIVILNIIIMNNGCGKGGSDFMYNLNWNYQYNDKDLVNKIIDPAGKIIEFNYEFFRTDGKSIRSIQKTTADSKALYQFNQSGQLMKIVDDAGATDYDYFDTGLLKSVKEIDNPSVNYTYNSAGMITSISLNNRYRVEYQYDFLNRLSAIKIPSGEIKYNYYTGDGIIERQLPNGIKTQYKYSPDGKLESITHINKDNYILIKYSYTYTPDGLISSIDEWTTNGEKKINYKFDQVQRLISFTDGKGNKTEYEYDNFGNRTKVIVNGKATETCTYDGLGRLKTINGKTCTYDGAGNFLSVTEGTNQFKYNGENLLQKVNDISYEYDGNGLLISRTDKNQKTNFINNPLADTWQPLCSSNEKGNENYYIWEGNNPIAVIENGKTKFLLTDYLSSVRAVTDEKGNLTQQINYTPFGMPDQTFSSNDFIPGFAGLFYEPDVKIYLTKSRAYSPYSGRFLQVDPQHRIPMGSQKDFSLYAYCGEDPINYKDIIGTQSQFVWGPENRAWQFLHNFSPTYAKQFYANKSNQAIQNARGRGILGGMEATAWDLIGGYIPGKAANKGQEKAQLIWSLLSAGTGSAALTGLGLGRTFTSSLVNSFEGNYGEAALDIVSLSGFELDKRAKNLLTESNGQMMLNFMNNKAKLMSDISESIEGFDFLRLSNKTHHELKSFYFPSNVGGVYLGGAGNTLEGLGQLSGVGIDEANGKLVLISEDKGKIDLPPLRIDDIVTVFRSVYQDGEAPYVSIDPDSVNPRGPVMHARHGKATENTYVGWILFESDRIMKAFSLGEDNITKKQVTTKIAGYDDVLNSMFEGENKQETWERFWIVPASVDKNVSTKNELTLFKVPLMVKTQKMIMKHGKLERAPDGKISKGAEKFAKWFTANYDKIAEESYSLPPKGSRFDKPVPVFKELERIAVVTAIAEQLRDQGVVFPFWMRSYNVKTFQTPDTTPAHTVTRKNGNSILSVYGGVNLSPSDDKIITKKSSPEANRIEEKISGTFKTLNYFKAGYN